MSAAVAERPRCKCGVYMEIRDNNGGGWTPEQEFCGVWYDHPPMPTPHVSFGHYGSTLLPSKELLEQIGSAS